MPGVLYISYDGMMEPLGQSQVLAYLKRLASDFPIHLVSFEKERDWARVSEREKLAQEIAAAGIVWHPLRYHKSPSAPATAFDVAQGIVLGTQLVRRHKLSIVHARSYVPALMAMEIKKLTGAKFIFDMRGFWADERVDAGLWRRDGAMYRTAKWFERQFFLNADHVVSLTHAAIREMQKFPYLQERFPPYSVIPTCADLDRFKPADPESRKNRPFTIGYVGTVSGWYLWEHTVRCFQLFLEARPDVRFLIVNRNEHDFIKRHLAEARIPESSFDLVESSYSQMPQWISRMDATVFFIRPSWSKKASSPTKLGEFLGCGVPCLVNSGVGDMDEVVASGQAGFVINDFDDPSLREGIVKLMHFAENPLVAARCRDVAVSHFSLESGIRSYMEAYSHLN